MWMNGFKTALVCFVVCHISHYPKVTEQTQILSRKQGEVDDDIGISHNGLTNNRIGSSNDKLLARNNVVQKDKPHKDHVLHSLVGHLEENAKGTRKRKTNHNHHTEEGSPLISHKTRTRLWNDIVSLVKLAKGKEGNASKNSNKLTNHDTKLKNDKKLLDSVNDTTKTKNGKITGISDVGESKNTKKHRKTGDTVSSVKNDRKKHRKSRNKKTSKRKERKKHRNTSKVVSKTKLEALYDALLVHPFNTWKFKDRFNSMADIGIHEAQLHDVVENRWNTRLKHKLFKVFKGENIHLAVIGGSNSAGGGIQQDEGRTDMIFFRVISDWWRKTITPITGSHLKTRQIAIGGTGSDFFQYCHRAYVQDNVDLVLLEMSVNDLHQLPYKVNLSLPIEQLTRQLLEYPTEPALIYVNLLSGRSYYQGCTNLEDFGQRLLSNAYEVTTFSWRDAVCPIIGGKYRAPLKGCSVVCKDGHHINQLGHAHISLMVINLVRDLLLGSIDHVDEMSRQVFHDEVILPKPVFIASPSKIVTDPICWTTVTPNFKRKIITNSMEVGVMENYGFEYLNDKPIGGNCISVNACRADAYSGWTGQDVGAMLTVSFTVPSLGHKREIQSRSVVFATRTGWKCGVAEVWLDDDVVNRRRVIAKSQYAQTWLEIIALRVNPGDHTMNVKVVQPGMVSVVGVMLGPPDGPY